MVAATYLFLIIILFLNLVNLSIILYFVAAEADPEISKGGCTIRDIHAWLFKIHHAHRQFSREFSKSGRLHK